MSSSLRLGNMVGGLGWLRRRVCTCRLGSPPPASYPFDVLHFRDFASPTMAHPRCRELCKRAGSLRLAELFRPILFLLLPGSYSFLKVDGSGVRVSAGSTLRSSYAYAYAYLISRCNGHLFGRENALSRILHRVPPTPRGEIRHGTVRESCGWS